MRFFINNFHVLLSLLFILSACSGVSGSNQSSSQPEHLEPLVENIYTQNSFVFQGFDWLTSSDEIAEHENLQGTPLDDADRYVVEGEFPLYENIKQNMIYTFEDHQLVSGRYVFSTANPDTFDQLAEYIEQILSSALPGPTSTESEPLNHHTAMKDNHIEIRWEAEDTSTLVVNVDQYSEGGSYFLSLTLGSPMPEVKSLKEN
ncbi:hypothetical protein [Aureibacillus halotolerans]|uniref:Lipoprotein n=1 Tax=Aureibacillus halotolerans TaxID=1508390 RepID=A0A4R6U767_9BACI|nr:hypothetical protein [Aureibacillus halotolerans]TDQ42358.1 hypothetical protein EV213_102392 [Aureibacillus halotolerans]